MSRFELCAITIGSSMPQMENMPTGVFDVAYGYDHFLGYFFDLIALTPESNPHYAECDVEPEHIAFSVCSLWDGLTGAKMGELLRAIDAEPSHIECAFLDMPFPDNQRFYSEGCEVASWDF